MKKYILFVLFVFIHLQGRLQVKDSLPQLLTQLAQSKTDSTRIEILTQLGYYYFYKVSLVNNMDSVGYYLKQARTMNERFHSVTLQNQINILSAKQYLSQHPAEDARNVFMPLIEECKRTVDKAGEAQAWNELAVKIVEDTSLNGFKINCYQNAMVLFRQLGYKEREMDLLRSIAAVHIDQRKFDLAASELFQIIKEEKNISPFYMAYAYDLLTSVYVSKAKYDSAMIYVLKTQQMIGISGDTILPPTLYMRLSEIAFALGKPAESLEWARKALDYRLATNNLAGIYSNIDYIAYLFSRQGKHREALSFLLEQINKKRVRSINDQRRIQRALGDTYDDLKMYDLAEKSYVEMIRLGNEQTNDYAIEDKGYDYCNFGSFYFRRGEYNKALALLEKALVNYEAYGEYLSTKIVHTWLFKTDSALGNYVSAIKHLKESNRLGDSIFNIARTKQTEELQVAYKTEQKDKDFRLLESKAQLAQVQLQNTKNIRNWTIAGASMLLIIAGLLFRQGQVRKKNNGVVNSKNKQLDSKNKQLEHLVTEKDWLVKEIHHRVKNNLQIVMSLLNSQSAFIENDAALTAIHDSQHRVQAMSLIHQKLYGDENVSTIDMSFYIRELVSYLSDSFSTGQRIRFELSVEPVEMDVSQSVPLGLILNEAITNSIKYAFPDGRNGVIAISLIHKDNNHYLLSISDNGIGMPVHTNNNKTSSLGMSLMAGLSEDLDGKFSIENNNGTTIRISFIQDSGSALPNLSTTAPAGNN